MSLRISASVVDSKVFMVGISRVSAPRCGLQVTSERVSNL